MFHVFSQLHTQCLLCLVLTPWWLAMCDMLPASFVFLAVLDPTHSQTILMLNIQWKLSNTGTGGTKIIVLISEVFLFQGENIMKLGLNQVS